LSDVSPSIGKATHQGKHRNKADAATLSILPVSGRRMGGSAVTWDPICTNPADISSRILLNAEGEETNIKLMVAAVYRARSRARCMAFLVWQELGMQTKMRRRFPESAKGGEDT
jgi:hypothetical protein